MLRLKNTKALLLIAIVSAALITILVSATAPHQKNTTYTAGKKIQVAVLLDVSNSMDGLIEQTKSQLWTMVNSLGKATCEGKVPSLEIALYEYGRSNNDVAKGYVKQINAFITDLDSLSANLFSLKTNGGEEYCGEVIFKSIDELAWSTDANDYKVIFIAGNEDFLQGPRQFTEGCKLAKEKGIIVNTIYCGDAQEGTRLHWNLGGECGNGSYKNINSNVKDVYIPTPQDSMIYVLNSQLNGTYVSYGLKGEYAMANQAVQDNNNTRMSKKAGIDRAVAKANTAVYRNDSWDLVDADNDGKYDWSKLDRSTIADSLKTKSVAEIKQIVATKRAERGAIQNQIADLSKQRAAYLVAYNKRNTAANNTPTLETEMNAVLKEQAKRFNIVVE